jgi:hypothetical protein
MAEEEKDIAPVEGSDNGWDLPAEAEEVTGADE